MPPDRGRNPDRAGPRSCPRRSRTSTPPTWTSTPSTPMTVGSSASTWTSSWRRIGLAGHPTARRLGYRRPRTLDPGRTGAARCCRRRRLGSAGHEPGRDAVVRVVQDLLSVRSEGDVEDAIERQRAGSHERHAKLVAHHPARCVEVRGRERVVGKLDLVRFARVGDEKGEDLPEGCALVGHRPRCLGELDEHRHRSESIGIALRAHSAVPADPGERSGHGPRAPDVRVAARARVA